MRWIIVGFLVSIVCLYVNGQAETIDTIYISESSIRTQHLGSASQNLNGESLLSEELVTQSAVFIKNYGPGSIATSSIRGGSAGHTLVLWNGLPIQNPFLGLLDLSLIDSWVMSETSLQKGGNTAMWGSGAIGGVISLSQRNEEVGDFAITNQIGYGSFNRFSEKAKLSFRTGQVKFKSSLSYLEAENDYPYAFGNGMRKIQTNARQQQFNLNQDIYWTPNSNNELIFHYWRSRNERQIPPTTVQSFSDAMQFDGADRFALRYKNFSGDKALRANLAYFSENLDYEDPIQSILSKTYFQTLILDVDRQFKLKTHHIFNFGFSHFRTSVSSPANYEETAREIKTAAFISYQYRWLQISGRQEIVNGEIIPFVPVIALDYDLTDQWELKGKISKNYRLPTLNDRFWVPGGNPDILPESGWSEEVSLGYQNQKGQLLFSAGLTAFNRVIDNWIQWTQTGPENINRVWSRGLEVDFDTKWVTSIATLGLAGSYSLVRSTNQVALAFPRIAAGDQLFYTPIHQAHLGWTAVYKKVQFNYLHRFVGSTKGINDDLQAFHIGDLDLAYSRKPFEFHFRLNNLWNQQYKIIERRPMPGRNFEIILQYKFRSK